MTDSLQAQLEAQRSVIERHRPTPRTDAFIAAQPPVIFNGDERITARAVRDLMIAHAGHARQMERDRADLIEALRAVLSTSESEAKAELTKYTALENLSDAKPEIAASEKAMVEASIAERDARLLLARLEGAAK